MHCLFASLQAWVAASPLSVVCQEAYWSGRPRSGGEQQRDSMGKIIDEPKFQVVDKHPKFWGVGEC